MVQLFGLRRSRLTPDEGGATVLLSASLAALFRAQEHLVSYGPSREVEDIESLLTGSGWQKIVSPRDEENLLVAAAAARLFAERPVNAYMPQTFDACCELGRSHDNLAKFGLSDQYTGPFYKALYRDAFTGAFARYVACGRTNSLSYRARLDCIMNADPTEDVAAFSGSAGIARHFIDYERCKWKVYSPTSDSRFVFGWKGYGGRDTSDVHFVSVTLAESMRQHPTWKRWSLPAICLSVAVDEVHP